MKKSIFIIFKTWPFKVLTDPTSTCFSSASRAYDREVQLRDPESCWSSRGRRCRLGQAGGTGAEKSQTRSLSAVLPRRTTSPHGGDATKAWQVKPRWKNRSAGFVWETLFLQMFIWTQIKTNVRGHFHCHFVSEDTLMIIKKSYWKKAFAATPQWLKIH